MPLGFQQGEPVHQSIVSCAWRGQPSFISLLESGMDAELDFYTREFSDCSLSSPSDYSDSSFSSCASTSTILLDEVPRKKPRLEGPLTAASARKLIEDVLGTSSGGEEVLQEYHTTKTLTDATRRKLVNIIVAHMIDKHGQLPSKAVREEYALGIVTVFPSLKDPYSKKGYEHFYDAASSTGYISWRLKTIQRKIRRGHASTSSPTGFSPGGGGPNVRRSIVVDQQLDGDAYQEAISLLNHTTDSSVIFLKMRETFQNRQKLIHDSDKTQDIFSIFPRFLDTKGLMNQDFTLLFEEEVSNLLLQKWDPFFRDNVIKEAKRLTPTPELRRMLQAAESPGSELDEAPIGLKSMVLSTKVDLLFAVPWRKTCQSFVK
ncbi:uncharacterized protein LOC133148533 isoform X3 [Syngnathus typhle]|uniref:uncharacterized protein LOC133143902 isoform X3 n=1 Tax=Syngnathus typhle TaxID=161592 RepID=UPI002A6B8BD6|nr:uncharacterized protein LOC133143902 isoform X3 [Syngnathus typhle]XP_061127191.1 uncharacterized protein LOC133147118 isoform X3 [Syngnathus typhle]XP_061127396.1 uncharacterized protein LOC133148316 isoform X3 [Syngnathus typhle]XP_061127436.1 uncharacterized protein LOC133148343 isoform X3 [Syngnathus typhle]XP_061127556.1 uncharacterized protein LOC133148533 isoform X3 [Syngnathus typhle]